MPVSPRLRIVLVTLATILSAACDRGSPAAPTGTGLGGSSTSYQGQWMGAYRITSCTETVLAKGACDLVPQDGGGNITLTLTQSGTSVQGTLVVESVSFAVSGSVNNNALSLTGSSPGEGVNFNLTGWNSRAEGTTMTGTLNIVIAPTTPGVGSFTINGTLQGVTKQ